MKNSPNMCLSRPSEASATAGKTEPLPDVLQFCARCMDRSLTSSLPSLAVVDRRVAEDEAAPTPLRPRGWNPVGDERPLPPL